MGDETAILFQTWGPILVMAAVFYFLLYRPQKQEQKRRKEMLDNLKKGDKVVTIGGLYGTLGDISEKTVMIEVAKGVELKVARAAINGNVTDEKDG